MYCIERSCLQFLESMSTLFIISLQCKFELYQLSTTFDAGALSWFHLMFQMVNIGFYL